MTKIALFSLVAGIAALSIAVPTAAQEGWTAPQPANNPGSWAGTNDYPIWALREEIQGAVRFELDVDADGTVTACRVTGSSGHARLDEHTCALITDRARFDPATDDQGKPVAATWRNVVRWSIPGDSEEEYSPLGLFKLTYVVERDGSVSSCRLIGEESEAVREALCARIDASQMFFEGQDTPARVQFTFRMAPESIELLDAEPVDTVD